MNAITPLTTAGGTIHGEIFQTKAMPSAPTALATRAYCDAIVATAPTVTEFEALRTEVYRLRALVAELQAMAPRAPVVQPLLNERDPDIRDPLVYTWPYFEPKSLANLLAGAKLAIAGGDTPPTSPVDGMLWWCSTDGQLYYYYNDGSSRQWVVANS